MIHLKVTVDISYESEDQREGHRTPLECALSDLSDSMVDPIVLHKNNSLSYTIEEVKNADNK